MIIPEEPAENLKLLFSVRRAKAAVLIGEFKQNRSSLGQTDTVLLQYGISPISLTVSRHCAVRVIPPPKSVHTGSKLWRVA